MNNLHLFLITICTIFSFLTTSTSPVFAQGFKTDEITHELRDATMDAIYAYGMEMHHKGNIKEAIAAYEHLLRLDPHNTKTINCLVKIDPNNAKLAQIRETQSHIRQKEMAEFRSKPLYTKISTPPSSTAEAELIHAKNELQMLIEKRNKAAKTTQYMVASLEEQNEKWDAHQKLLAQKHAQEQARLIKEKEERILARKQEKEQLAKERAEKELERKNEQEKLIKEEIEQERRAKEEIQRLAKEEVEKKRMQKESQMRLAKLHKKVKARKKAKPIQHEIKNITPDYNFSHKNLKNDLPINKAAERKREQYTKKETPIKDSYKPVLVNKAVSINKKIEKKNSYYKRKIHKLESDIDSLKSELSSVRTYQTNHFQALRKERMAYEKELAQLASLRHQQAQYKSNSQIYTAPVEKIHPSKIKKIERKESNSNQSHERLIKRHDQSIKEMRRNHARKMDEIARQYQNEIEKYQSEIDSYRQEATLHKDRLAKVQENYDEKMNEIIHSKDKSLAEYKKQITSIQEEHAHELDVLNKTLAAKNKIANQHENNIASWDAKHQEVINELKRLHSVEIAQLNEKNREQVLAVKNSQFELIHALERSLQSKDLAVTQMKEQLAQKQSMDTHLEESLAHFKKQLISAQSELNNLQNLVYQKDTTIHGLKGELAKAKTNIIQEKLNMEQSLKAQVNERATLEQNLSHHQKLFTSKDRVIAELKQELAYLQKEFENIVHQPPVIIEEVTKIIPVERVATTAMKHTSIPAPTDFQQQIAVAKLDVYEERLKSEQRARELDNLRQKFSTLQQRLQLVNQSVENKNIAIHSLQGDINRIQVR